MRILFLGDVVGRTARQAILENSMALKEEFALDFLLLNVENAAGGFGITPPIADSFLEAGVDVMTTGNHVWDKREIFPYIEKQERLLRPLNMPEGVPGSGSVIVTNKEGKRLAVANLIGNLFMGASENVFKGLDEVLQQIRLGRDADAFVIDIHGEATSEKMALGFLADGFASLVVGTHTHIPTSDYRILPKGTAYQSDIGMCGAYDSVIGMDKEGVIAKFLGTSAQRFEVAKGEATLSGILVETNDKTGLARSVAPFRRGGVLSPTD